MDGKDDREEHEEFEEFEELEDLEDGEEQAAGGIFGRARKRILEDWQRRKHHTKTGTTLTLVELEVKRVQEQRELEKDIAERFDEPGIGERKSAFPFMAYLVYPLIGLLIVGIPVAVVIKKIKAVDLGPGPKRDREAVLEMDEKEFTTQSARQVAETFLKAPSLDERLVLARDPEAVRLRLPDYYADSRACPVAFADLRGMGLASASGEARFHRFAVYMADGRMRFLPVVQTPRGPLVDYDAFARYGTARWEDLMEGAAAEELRVAARWSSYHQFQFEDEKKWLAFELSNPDWPLTLTGYAPKESLTAGVLFRITGKKSKQRVTLRIRPDGESYRNRQVVIEKVLASGWVRTEGDLEARWLMKGRPKE